ncbi:putative ABC transporter permease [Terrisporobacter petrolearius]|uniref:putative ABC transporter permease n=1 Tax=Terrisporobacter petrolearius TaxID=1460447 RepID=UPI001D16DAB5|nr:putative ABC transporter permease [Terrisporobacter petrolearius]MCC3865629.1 putative ABC transporter permease [Terrisporobacter petrolearius]
MKILNTILKYLTLFLIGGITYYFIEIVYRGYSHYSMIIVGGLCFILIGSINEFSNKEIPLLLQMLISVLIVNIVELVSGIIINRILLLNVWDYSQLKYNFLGQISLNSSIAWFFLSLFAIYMDDLLRYVIFKEKKPKYKFI